MTKDQVKQGVSHSFKLDSTESIYKLGVWLEPATGRIHGSKVRDLNPYASDSTMSLLSLFNQNLILLIMYDS